MKRLLVSLSLTILAVAGVLSDSSALGLSCSHTANPEAIVANYDLVVAGRVTQIYVAESYSGPDASLYTPARVRIEVDRTLKGESPSGSVEFYDFSIQRVLHPSLVGSRLLGPCWDAPVGTSRLPYAIVGLAETDRDFQASKNSWLFVGYDPSGDEYESTLSMLESAGKSGFPLLPVIGLAVLGPLAFLVGAAFLWRRGRLV